MDFFFEVRTHPTFLETWISKYDFGPVKLPGLQSINGRLKFFQALISQLLKFVLNNIPSFSSVQIYELSYIHLHLYFVVQTFIHCNYGQYFPF